MLEKVNRPDDLKKLDFRQLNELCGDIREFLIRSVTATGGHLSPNLGVVELTVALHRVFHSPQDSIIWDVGHQSYVHKIITGRKARFGKLRMRDGLGGYPNPNESKYDTVHAGHSSTSISIAAGIARAKILKKDRTDTIAVIGDGAFTAGMVYEALNHIAHENLPVTVVLNDNGMSISKNVGGISRYLKKLELSRSYLHFKKSLERILRRRVPIIGVAIIRFLYRAKQFFKSILMRKNFFEDLGISYYGPVDGHDLKKLVQIFDEVRGIGKPIILHVITTKGKGYQPSEENPGGFHGISGNAAAVALNGDSSIPVESKSASYSDVFGDELCRIARRDPLVYAVTAAMKTGTGLKKFAQEFPGRMADVGIAEQHAVDFAFGLSLQGYKPVVAIYSTFLQRGFDQLVHDIGISNGKVLFCLDRAGLVPGDGETHQGVFDISFIRLIPNFTMLLPATAGELRMMLKYSLKDLGGPVCIRYPKDEAADFDDYEPLDHKIVPGEGVVVKKGKDVIIVSTGVLLKEALKAAGKLKKREISAEIYHLRFAKPINNGVVRYLSRDSRPVLVIEEGVYNGGVAEYLENRVLTALGAGSGRKQVSSVTIPDIFPGIGSREELLERFSLTAGAIENKIVQMLSDQEG
jgi:1-deoxy-D-xylulose-5-phosphate synthase